MFSHPDKELKKHSEEVYLIGMSIFDSKKNSYTEDENIRKTLEIILKMHDYGKGTCYFQEYLRDGNNFLKKFKENLKNHSALSAVFTYLEILEKVKDKKLAMIGYYIVSRHHGELIDFSEKIFSEIDEDNLKKQLKKFDFQYFSLNEEEVNLKIEEFLKTDFQDEIEEYLEELDMNKYLLINYLFSILISADKGAAIYAANSISHEELKKRVESREYMDKELVDLYKKIKFGESEVKNIDKIREKIYKEVEKEILKDKKNRIFSINVPTGSGKTLTSFNAALKLRDKLGGNFKIIYNLPFTSVIDQNFSVFQDILGEKGKESSVILKHHYLSQMEFKVSEESLTYDISEYLIENWESEVIVTTFVQFFHTLFSNKNRKLKKIHAISNSIIILDEVQSLPHRYWKLVNEFLKKMVEQYNSYIILVTATMPLIFDETKGEIVELAKGKEEYFKNFDRIVLNKEKISISENMDDFFVEVKEDIKKSSDKSFLFIMNTINSSINLYEELCSEFLEKDIYYLSTNIIPKERNRIIIEIKENLRKGEAPILISTQVIEAGVDIDFHMVYRDFSILDSINQSCGRCNRNGKDKLKGKVKLFKLKDEKKEYSKYIYDSFLLDITEETLKEELPDIEERSFFDLAHKYFKKIKERGSQKESDILLKEIKKLNYGKIGDDFNLIPKSYETVDLFIELDEEAEILKEKCQNLFEIEDKYERKRVYDGFKNEFLSYVISVPKQFFKEGKEGINFVERNSLKVYYDCNTGFKRNLKQEDFFF